MLFRTRIQELREDLRAIAEKAESKLVRRTLLAIAASSPGGGVFLARTNPAAIRWWLAELADEVHPVDPFAAEALLALAEKLPKEDPSPKGGGAPDEENL